MIYVVGMSGSGKSYWTTNYVKEYLKKFKKQIGLFNKSNF